MTPLTIGELLRRHRIEASLTQRELADQIGCHNSVVSRVERGDQLPTPEYLQRFIMVLKLPEEENRKVLAICQSKTTLAFPLIPQVERQEDWGEAPDVSIFYGRYKDLTKLTQWLVNDHCRLVAVLGMGGIGKTALATKLATQTVETFDYIIWRSLRNAPPLSQILTECLLFLSDQKETSLPDNIEQQITSFINFLDHQHCLVILDNVEAIMEEGKAGHYREGYKEYGTLLERVGKGRHQSCLLLTSREKPREIGELEGETLPVRSYQLEGLTLEAGQQILLSKGLSGSEKAWARLIEKYSGNPLALNLVAEMIREVYDGNIDSFLTDDEVIFGRIGDVIEEQFERLSALEQSLMYWLAIEQELVSQEVLFNDLIQPVSKRELIVALRSLRRRSLVEKSDAGFTLQNVVMEYVTDRLVSFIYDELTTETLQLFRTHALIKAQAKEYVRESQGRLILRPTLEKLLAVSNKGTIENKLKNLLSGLRDEMSLAPNYAAGNILNLLICLKSNLNNYDFSHLCIWQAYLQGVDLQGVNFKGANLARSVFTETFGVILSVAFNSAGDLLAVGSENGDIRLWQTETGLPLMIYEEHTGGVWALDFSPTEDYILASADRIIRLWDIRTGECIKVFQGHSDTVRLITFSSDGLFLAGRDDDQIVRVWDVKTGQCLEVIKGYLDVVWTLTFSSDNHVLASGSRNQIVGLWDLKTNQCITTFSQPASEVDSYVITHESKLLASANNNQSVKIWDAEIGHLVEVLQGHTEVVTSIAFSSDGKLLASGSRDQTVRLWSLDAGQCIRTLVGHSDVIWSIAFNPDDQILASGSRDQTVRLWDTSTGKCLRTLQGYADIVWTVTFSPDGHTLLSGHSNGTIRLIEVSTGHHLKTWQEHNSNVRSVTFSSDGRLYASCSQDKSIRLWDVNTGQCLHILRGHNAAVTSVKFSPDGQILASSSSDQTVRLWKVSDGKLLHILNGHINRVHSITFSPNEKILVSGGDDQVLRWWDTQSGQQIKTLQDHTHHIRSVVFSPDGSILASGGADHTIRLWDTKTGTCFSVLEGHVGTVLSLAFHSKNSLLASGSRDETVRLWDVKTGRALEIFQGHHGIVWSVAFSPVSDALVSGSLDETTKFWDITTGQCLNTLQPHRPYKGMNIIDVIGLTEAQKSKLKALGATEE